MHLLSCEMVFPDSKANFSFPSSNPSSPQEAFSLPSLGILGMGSLLSSPVSVSHNCPLNHSDKHSDQRTVCTSQQPLLIVCLIPETVVSDPHRTRRQKSSQNPNTFYKLQSPSRDPQASVRDTVT